MLNVETSELKGITSFTTYDGGEMKECKLEEYNLIHTKYGDFVPQYGNPGFRKKQFAALSFYKSGKVRSISLEQQTEINTPIGIFPSELITFFENGFINSLFPLNGQISGFWSEEEEGELAQRFHFSFPFGDFYAKIIGLRFYQDGRVRSLILWPNEKIIIDTPAGKMPVRIGFKLFEDGRIESVEPAEPFLIETPIGSINVYDVDALGIDADKNSLCFDRKGRLVSLLTLDTIIIKDRNGKGMFISPKLRLGPLEDEFEEVPVKLFFEDDILIIYNDGKTVKCKISECTFRIISGNYVGVKKCTNCSNCTNCIRL
jgi:hypothetical protein